MLRNGLQLVDHDGDLRIFNAQAFPTGTIIVKSQPSLLIIVQNLPVPFDRRVWQEATSLAAAGFGVAVICPKKNMYRRGYERISGIDIYRYPMLYDADRAAFGFFVEFLFCWLATLWLAARAYLHRPFHAIHACNPPDTYFALALLFRPLGVKFVFDHHDLCPEMYAAKGYSKSSALYRGLLFLERCTLRSADAVIAVNISHRDIAIRRGAIDPARVTVVRSGPPRAWCRGGSSCEDLRRGRQFLVVCLGEMGSQDGVDLLLRAIHHYAGHYPRNVLFTLIGGGPEQPRMQQLARDLGLDEWVYFTGRISDDILLRSYLTTADICVAPDPLTEYGNFSTVNKIIEYLAMGKPVVAFDLLEHRRTAQDSARYVTPNDSEALSDAVYSLLHDEEKRLEMGRVGQWRFVNDLAWEISEVSLVDLYRRLLEMPAQVAPRLADSR